MKIQTKLLFFLFLVLINSLNAKEYKIDILLDNETSKYFDEIKKQANSLLFVNDKITYKTKVCDSLCKESLSLSSKKIVLLNDSRKYNKIKSLYIVSYNFINTKYEKEIFVRSSALAIFEYLKENIKSKSIYLKNKEVLTVLEKNTNHKKLDELDLKKIFALALKNNLSLQQNENSLKLMDLNTNEAKSSYKPSLSVFSDYILIDKDRAKYSNGVNSEGTFDAGISLKQLIYSNKVIQNIKINKLLYKSSLEEMKALQDETMYKSTLIYLNIIKAKKYKEIINIKYNFIAQNLEFAKQRVKIGVRDRSDIYRFESELATANIELSNAKKVLNSLKIELANLLQIETGFFIHEYNMNSKLFKLLKKDAISYIGNKKVQNTFINSIVHTHSRLKQLAKLQDAKEDELLMNKESRYLPTVAFEGSAKRIINRDGEGKDFSRAWDNEEYQGVINLTIPLYEGGLKNTKIEKNRIELINLKLKYNDVKNLIIENVKKNYESFISSYEKINYSKISKEASQKNFELIQDKYKNGKENIISLLDAQNAYIVSQLNLNISIIDYLVDLSSIYFFSGKINILVDEKRKEELENKILSIVKGSK